jgi:hypothetical protein
VDSPSRPFCPSRPPAVQWDTCLSSACPWPPVSFYDLSRRRQGSAPASQRFRGETWGEARNELSPGQLRWHWQPPP